MHMMAFDFGLKHIGVAIGQSLTKTATPLTSISAIDGIPRWTEMDTLIQAWKPIGIIVGIPLNMDDSEQLLTHCARKFIKRLQKRYHIPVDTVDERLSSWEAKNRLRLKKRDKPLLSKKQIQDINAMAAAILLEQWIHDNPT